MKILDSSQQSGHEWYPDTGITTHVTNSTQHLHESQPYKDSDSSMVRNGDFLPISHIGSIDLPTLSGTLPLKDVKFAMK